MVLVEGDRLVDGASLDEEDVGHRDEDLQDVVPSFVEAFLEDILACHHFQEDHPMAVAVAG